MSDYVLQPHEQRVVAEKAELDEKLTKLIQFRESLNSPYERLSGAEQNRLHSQATVMRQYSSILADRISAFGAVK